MLKPIYTIAFYTLLEALRNRLAWLLLLITLAGIGLSGFLNEVALTEKREIQTALLAAVLRFSTVFLLATFVVTSIVRESNDKGVELLLALPLPRASYLFGKMAGFAMLAVLPAVLFCALFCFLTSPAQSMLWSFSLILECWIMIAFSLLCVLSLNQVVLAMSAVLGFYLLGRLITTLQIISNQPLLEKTSSQQLIQWMVDSLSMLLPHLDAFTRTDWLVYHTGDWQTICRLSIQCGIYLALLSGAALVDLYRKNI